MIPLGLYTVGMHHQDTSRHPWVRDFTNSWDTCSQRAVVAPEAFRPAVVQRRIEMLPTPAAVICPLAGQSSTMAPAAPRVLVRA